MDEEPNLLSRIHSPADLRSLDNDDLSELAEQMRRRIIDVVSRRGGHLASNLGIAELTIALHSVFDFARDRLLWDVGHQCYPHKLLTGRGERFDALRQGGGLSGFPAPSESEYDLFATGHAGTAISTAVGMALADQQAHRDSRVVAVVGDASIVNGLSFEGLNNAGTLNRQLLIVLNDNSMAIDRTRGALAHALDRIRTTSTYSDLKNSTKQLLSRLPLGGNIAEALHNVKEVLRTGVHGEKFFEPLGLHYFGPVDGHDIRELTWILRRLRDVPSPCILHVHTEKGRGCEYAVEDPCRFHSPSAYRVENGRAVFESRSRPSWTRAFAEVLIEKAHEDEDVVAITAAMPDGTGLARFRQEHPERTLDVGISESHAIAMAAGLAKGGRKPVAAIYSTFLQRAVDQVFHEVCLQKLPVVICMDRAGLVGSDGAVHHGIYDIAMLRSLPGIVLAAPADRLELRRLMDFALASDKPVAIRYPRDDVPEDLPGPCPPFEPGQSRVLREGPDATLVCYGAMCSPALAAAKICHRESGLDVAVINARFAKPLDGQMLRNRLDGKTPMLVVEDHAAMGGLGSALLEAAAKANLPAGDIAICGVEDRFVPHGSRGEQLTDAGLCAGGIVARLKKLVSPGKAAGATRG
jgi:1-deoxy-D-xylulose-5-phosphate synthase